MAGGATSVEQAAGPGTGLEHIRRANGQEVRAETNGDADVDGVRALVGTMSRGPNKSVHTRAGQRPTDTLHRTPRLLQPEVLAFIRLESRDGVVLDVDAAQRVFRARLVDPKAVEPDQEIELEIEQVSLADRALVEPGALFFWAIGYVTRSTGRRNLVLSIDFRRLPKPRLDVEQRAKQAAADYVQDMEWI